MRRLRDSKKGAYFFLIDVFLGIFIFVMSIVIMLSFNVFLPSSSDVQQRMETLTEDLFVTQLQDADISNTHVNYLRFNKNPYYSPYISIDQLVYLLYNHSQLENATKLIGNTTSWLPPTFGINYTINGEEIYSRQAQTITLEESLTGLIKTKITMVSSNVTSFYDPVVTKLEIWQ